MYIFHSLISFISLFAFFYFIWESNWEGDDVSDVWSDDGGDNGGDESVLTKESFEDSEESDFLLSADHCSNNALILTGERRMLTFLWVPHDRHSRRLANWCVPHSVQYQSPGFLLLLSDDRGNLSSVLAPGLAFPHFLQFLLRLNWKSPHLGQSQSPSLRFIKINTWVVGVLIEKIWP